MNDIAIKIENLKKTYKLGEIGGTTLTAELQNWWAKKLGKESPNARIGVDQADFGKKFYALDGINLEVKKGEALGVIGSNGAGKSTLLKILSRVTAPSEGCFGVNGRIASMLEVGTGFSPYLTGRENIYMNGAILGMSKNEVDKKIENIIDFSECRKFIDTPVKRYSSGMYVKLAFAVAAHLDAEIMIMDEVLAVGDVKFQEKCLGSMGNAANSGQKTILYVSHNMNTIRQLCRRCVVLDHGQIVFDGDTEKAIEVYMDRKDAQLKNSYNLNEVKRPSLDHGKDIHIKSFEFLNGRNGVFEDENVIKFKITWTSRIDDKTLRMYIPLKFADSTPVGMAQSVEFLNKGYDTENEVTFKFDISNLIEGKYYFSLDFFNINKYGAHKSYDHPCQDFYFEIKRNFYHGIAWQRRYWGSVMLNDIQVE